MSNQSKEFLAQYGSKEHLDKLVDDPDPYVRETVAYHSKEHLDKLINDENPYVRVAVAKNGNQDHLEKLIHDPHYEVNNAANKRLKELNK